MSEIKGDLIKEVTFIHSFLIFFWVGGAMLCGLQDLSSQSEIEPVPSAAKAWIFWVTGPPGNSLIPRIFTESLLC